MARKHSSIADALFLPNVRDVLAVTTLHPQQEWYLSDLAAHLHLRPSSLQRTVAKLAQAGILQRRRDGNRVYYRVDTDCPILQDLTSIMTKTVGIAERIREALDPLASDIEVAFIHGSIATGRERSESDIDLIVVGDFAAKRLAVALRPLSEQLGRLVNATRYTPMEFASRLKDGHPFLRAVIQKPRIFVIGDEHDLKQAAGEQANRLRTLKQERA